MPSNDDLFAGLTIGSRKVPTVEQKAVISAGISPNDADLFEGFSIGGSDQVSIPPIAEDVQPEPITEPVAAPLSQIVPEVAAAAVEAVETIQAPETGFVDFLTGSERIKATPELGEIPEFGSTKGSARAFGMFTTLDPIAQIQILKDSIPGAITETTPDGSIIIEVPLEGGGTERSVLNRPGFSSQDVADAVVQVIQFLPAAKLATLGKTLLKKVIGGAAGSAATEQALQETGIEFLGREQRDPTATAIAGALGGAGEAIVPAVQAFRGSRQAAKLGVERAEVEAAKESIKPAQEAIRLIEEITGVKVGLFPAQQTLTPSELLKQRILPQLDAGARKSAEALKVQNKQVSEATEALINLVAPESNVVGGSKRLKEAAVKAVKAVKDERSRIVGPLYRQAAKLAEGKEVDLKPVIRFVEEQLKKLVADDPAAVALNSFVKRLAGEKTKDIPSGLIIGESGEPIIKGIKGTNKPLTLDQLQSAKRTTDTAIDNMGGLVPSTAQSNAKRLLTQVEKLYVDQLGKLSPEFKAANQEFARLSKPIDDLQNSLIGEVIKVDDAKLRNISTTIFNPKEAATSPQAIRQAREVIEKTSPDAWNDILRVEINRRIAGVRQLADDLPELIGNEPGQIRRALFGNPSQRAALMAGLNKEQKKNFTYLEDLLRRSESGRAAGSPTEGFRRATEKLKGAFVVLRDVIFRPLESLQKTGETGLFDRNVAALTEVMFNPNFAPQLSKLRKLNPNSPAAARALTQLFKRPEDNNDE
jgi:tRNA threonylcarbamoyladenosine modification (KEOPS) complex Cgi121 subunit